MQGWSPECGLGTHGMLIRVKQWQQPSGHEHSEQRWRQTVPVRQQNHSPEVEQPTGQPPASWHGLQGRFGRLAHSGCGEPHGLQGPPPQPEQPPTAAPSETPVRVSQRPVPSEPAPRSLKNCRRDERRASVRAAFAVTSTSW